MSDDVTRCQLYVTLVTAVLAPALMLCYRLLPDEWDPVTSVATVSHSHTSHTLHCSHWRHHPVHIITDTIITDIG